MAANEEHTVALLGEYDHGVRRGWHPDYFSWRLFHALSFLTGGTTFIAGTLCLFYPNIPGFDFWSAVLYTIGSFGFLFVDVQEFFTFGGFVLRCNISMSMLGSFLYVVGSAGFLPAVAAWNPAVGIWGFILGSAFIGVSQLWKTHRIGSQGGSHPFSIRLLLSEADAATACGVELGAGLGAWCFFFGTSLYNRGPLEGPESVLYNVLLTWVMGSCLFTFGGLCVAYRHFVMDVV
ncbi:hypothetical protein V8C86DRAFT_2584309 [Haematococcus lacustris]